MTAVPNDAIDTVPSDKDAEIFERTLQDKALVSTAVCSVALVLAMCFVDSLPATGILLLGLFIVGAWGARRSSSRLWLQALYFVPFQLISFGAAFASSFWGPGSAQLKLIFFVAVIGALPGCALVLGVSALVARLTRESVWSSQRTAKLWTNLRVTSSERPLARLRRELPSKFAWPAVGHSQELLSLFELWGFLEVLESWTLAGIEGRVALQRARIVFLNAIKLAKNESDRASAQFNCGLVELLLGLEPVAGKSSPVQSLASARSYTLITHEPKVLLESRLKRASTHLENSRLFLARPLVQVTAALMSGSAVSIELSLDMFRLREDAKRFVEQFLAERDVSHTRHEQADERHGSLVEAC